MKLTKYRNPWCNEKNPTAKQRYKKRRKRTPNISCNNCGIRCYSPLFEAMHIVPAQCSYCGNPRARRLRKKGVV